MSAIHLRKEESFRLPFRKNLKGLSLSFIIALLCIPHWAVTQQQALSPEGGEDLLAFEETDRYEKRLVKADRTAYYKRLVKDAPVFTSTPVTAIDDNATYTYPITISDADNDKVDITAPVIPDWLSVNFDVEVSTFVGGGTVSVDFSTFTNTYTDGNGTTASLNNAVDMDFDSSGNLYVASFSENSILKITPSGDVSGFIGPRKASFSLPGGDTDGVVGSATLNGPLGLIIASNDDIYIADNLNGKIRKVSGGVVSTVVSGLSAPNDVALDSNGDLIIVDSNDQTLLKYTIATSTLSTIAGGTSGNVDDTGTAARFNSPRSVVVDASDNMYVADYNNHSIRKVTPAGVVTTLAGNGTSGTADGSGSAASFKRPIGLDLDSDGNLMVADFGNNLIRKVTTAGVVSTVVGTGASFSNVDGSSDVAAISAPRSIAVAASGNIFVGHQAKVRKLATTTATLTGDPAGQEGVHNVTLRATDANNDFTDQSFTITVNDVTAPTPVITSASSNTVSGAFDITITFDDDMTGVELDDLTLGNGVGSNLAATNAKIYTATITPVSDGTVTVDFPAGGAIDNVGIANLAATQFSITNDETAPTGHTVTIDQSLLNGSNSGAASFSFSGAEVGAGYAYTFSSDGGGTDITNNGTIATATDQISNIDISGLNDGNITLSVVLTDPANNAAAAVTDSKTLDATKPSGYGVTIDQGQINSTNVSTVSFTFSSAEVGTTYNYTISSDAGGTDVTGSATVTTATDQITVSDLSGLNDGLLTLSVTLTDAAGNIGEAVTDSKSMDIVAPTIAINAISTDDHVNATEDDSDLTVSGTTSGAEDGQVVTLMLSSKNYQATVGSNTWSVAIPSADIQALTEDSHTITADATDQAGNAATQVNRSFTYDITAPTFTVDPVSEDNFINKSESSADNITISGTTPDLADNGLVVTLTLNGETYEAAVVDKIWSHAIPIADILALGENEHTIVANFNDRAGNPATQQSRNFTTEYSVPSIVSVTRISPTSQQTDADELEFQIVFDEAVLNLDKDDFVANNTTAEITASGTGTTYNLKLSGGDLFNVNADISMDFANGHNVGDAAGNLVADFTISGTNENLFNVINDQIAPVLTVTSVLTNDQTPALNGTVDEAVGDITVTVDGQSFIATNNGNGTWTVADDLLTTLAEGTYDIMVTATDLAGNQGTDNTTNELTIDLIAPTIAINTISTDDYVNATEDDSDLTVSGTTSGAEDGQVVTLTLNSKNYQATVGSNAWSLAIPSADIQALTEESHTMTADVTDKAGNAATQASRSITYDITPPTFIVKPISEDNFINKSEISTDKITVSGTTPDSADDGLVVTFTLNGTTYEAVVQGRNWRHDIPIANILDLEEKEHTLVANYKDRAGNAAAQIDRKLVYDITVPAPPVYTGLTNDTGISDTDNITNSQLLLNFDAEAGGIVRLFDLNLIITGNNNGETVEFPVNSGEAAEETAGKYLYTSFSSTVDGTYPINAFHRDAAGNESEPISFTVTLDTKAPTIDRLDDFVIGINASNQNQEFIEPLMNADNEIVSALLSVNGQEFKGAQNSMDNTFDIALGADFLLTLEEDVYEFSLKATDHAGNEATYIDDQAGPIKRNTLVKDISVPAVPDVQSTYTFPENETGRVAIFSIDDVDILGQVSGDNHKVRLAEKLFVLRRFQVQALGNQLFALNVIEALDFEDPLRNVETRQDGTVYYPLDIEVSDGAGNTVEVSVEVVIEDRKASISSTPENLEDGGSGFADEINISSNLEEFSYPISFDYEEGTFDDLFLLQNFLPEEEVNDLFQPIENPIFSFPEIAFEGENGIERDPRFNNEDRIIDDVEATNQQLVVDIDTKDFPAFNTLNVKFLIGDSFFRFASIEQQGETASYRAAGPPLSAIAPGEYKIVAEALDADGQVLKSEITNVFRQYGTPDWLLLEIDEETQQYVLRGTEIPQSGLTYVWLRLLDTKLKPQDQQAFIISVKDETPPALDIPDRIDILENADISFVTGPKRIGERVVRYELLIGNTFIDDGETKRTSDGHLFKIIGLGPDNTDIQATNNVVEAPSVRLEMKPGPDFENPIDEGKDNKYQFELLSEDAAGNTAINLVTIFILDGGDAPVFVDESNQERTTFEETVEESENYSGAINFVQVADLFDNTSSTIQYRLTNKGADDSNADFKGVDNDHFEFSPEGVLSFKSTSLPNFEQPKDANSDNIYEVEYFGFDGVHRTEGNFLLKVKIKNDDGLGIIAESEYAIAENSLAVFATMKVVPEIGTLTYSLGDALDETHFIMDENAGQLSPKDPFNFEEPGDANNDGTYLIKVFAQEEGGKQASKTIRITITDEKEFTPEFTSVPITTVDENQTYTYIIEVNDLDGDRVNVNSITFPDWLSLTTTPVVSTLAGSNLMGFANGPGIIAQFNAPSGVAVDAAGYIYVADTENNRIRKITPEREVSKLAGLGVKGFRDDIERLAQFNGPGGVAVDAGGNVYVADKFNNRIRKISPERVVSTLAGSTFGFKNGTGTEAQFKSPVGVAVDAAGNVYVADQSNHAIRKISPEGEVSTLAGSGFGFKDGPGTEAKFNKPRGVTVDAGGNVYVADQGNHVIRKISPGGEVSTLAGLAPRFLFLTFPGFRDGTGTVAQFNEPAGVAVDAGGNVYVADQKNHRIRKITPEGEVNTLAGSGFGFKDGPGTEAQFSIPRGVAVDGEGNVFVADRGNLRIRKISDKLVLTGNPIGQVGSHAVVLEVTDGKGGKSTQSFTITVTDVTPPEFTTVATHSFPENESGSVFTAEASDADPNLTYSLGSELDEALFSIDAATGEVSSLSPFNFEAPVDANADNVYELKVLVADQAGNTDSQTVYLAITNQEEAPAFSSEGTFEIVENTAGSAFTAVATDPEQLPDIVYGLGSGLDEALFAIDAGTGQVSFVDPLNFEMAQDNNSDNVYEILVQATDEAGSVGEQQVLITITNQEEAPIFSSEGSFEFTENTAGSAFTAAAADPEQLPDIAYGLGTELDEALFTIDAGTGEVSFAEPLNFEMALDNNSDNVYEILLLATDEAGSIGEQQVLVSITNQEEVPVFSSEGTFEIVENTAGSAFTAVATDPDQLPDIAYGLGTELDESLFTIDANTGEVSFSQPLNFEMALDNNSDNVYDILVQATDEAGSVGEQQVLITITNQEEAPAFSSEGTFEFTENTAGSAFTAVATDPEQLPDIAYGLGTELDEALFTIDANTGEVSFSEPLNFEMALDNNSDNVYEILLLATDEVGSVGEQRVLVSITNVNEITAFTSDPILSVNDDQVYGYVMTATDEDGDPLTYELLTSPDWLTIDGNLLQGSAVGVSGTHNIMVKVSDGLGGEDTQEFDLTVVDVTAPVLALPPNLVNVDENSSGAIGTISATDTDANITYSLDAASDAGPFSINAETGGVTIVSPLDFENPTDANADNIYEVRILATDGAGNVGEGLAGIRVLDLEAIMNVVGNLEIPPAPLEFNTPFDVEIINTGEDFLEISAITYPEGFSGPENLDEIKMVPGIAHTLTFFFTPTEMRVYTGTIVITSNGGIAEIAVSATGDTVTGVDDGVLEPDKIVLFPVPVDKILTIDLTDYGGKPLDITLNDLSGTERFKLSQFREKTLTLDVSAYGSGMYLMRFNNGSEVITKKVLIKR
ncbi:MAG: Ig-like domain-containing protein [Roseivirga sp.]|nr:Ig-like domain-containing protein [Roseivirga sp.]